MQDNAEYGSKGDSVSYLVLETNFDPCGNPATDSRYLEKGTKWELVCEEGQDCGQLCK